MLRPAHFLSDVRYERSPRRYYSPHGGTALTTVEKCPIHHVSLSKSNVISNLAVRDATTVDCAVFMLGCRCWIRSMSCTFTVGMDVGTSRGPYVSLNVTPMAVKRQLSWERGGATRPPVTFNRRGVLHDCPPSAELTVHSRCPNSLQCPRMLKRDLNTHLATCGHHPCQHKMRGCKVRLRPGLPIAQSCQFSGSVTAVEEHVKSCKYESIKGILLQSDATISSLKADIASKDQVTRLSVSPKRLSTRQEIGFLRSMLAKLSERVSQMESKFEQRIGRGVDT